MKATFEHVTLAEGCSLRVYHRRLQHIPFEWHHHPEYELTLTMNSTGKRYIGDSITDYGDNDLVLLPPDLPHSWSSNTSIAPDLDQVAVVLWFDGDWARRLASCCPEYAPLLRLMRHAGCGLSFGPDAAALMKQRLDELLSTLPRDRLMAALDILCLLADEPSTPLASPTAFQTMGRPSGHQPERINRILAMIDAQFAQPLSIAQLAEAGSLSPRSLHRYFLQHLGESVSRYLMRSRIAHACQLLVDTRLPIASIAMQSGYPNTANFNRQFRSLKQMTPLQYRKAFTDRPAAHTQQESELERRPHSLAQNKSGAD
jgi:AraC-like DNA-binding protein